MVIQLSLRGEAILPMKMPHHLEHVVAPNRPQDARSSDVANLIVDFVEDLQPIDAASRILDDLAKVGVSRFDH